MSADRLRVAATSVYGLRAGSDVGGEVYERELVRRLPAHGISELVALPAGHGPTPPEVRTWSRRGPSPHWTLAWMIDGAWLLARIRRDGAELLRAPSVRAAAPAALVARALAGRRVPVVVHHHHFTRRCGVLEAAILRRADAVITVSEFSAGQLRAAGVDGERVHVVHDGVSTAAIDAAADRVAAGAWPAAGLRLLHVGRLEQRKRPELALETVAGLAARGVPAALVLAGDGPLRAGLARRARELGVEDRVSLLGRVSEAEKSALYLAADVLLFGSTVEGFGLVVAEAQSLGLPVVAAAGTATVEALRDGESGLLVDPSAPAFVEAAARLADEDLRARMSSRAREFAARFSWDRCAAEVARILHQVARG